jgi:hypothetical protein
VPLASNVYGNSQFCRLKKHWPVILFQRQQLRRRRLEFEIQHGYYNPLIQYKPWIGLNRSNVDFANASPTAAPLDPTSRQSGRSI